MLKYNSLFRYYKKKLDEKYLILLLKSLYFLSNIRFMFNISINCMLKLYK